MLGRRVTQPPVAAQPVAAAAIPAAGAAVTPAVALPAPAAPAVADREAFRAMLLDALKDPGVAAEISAAVRKAGAAQRSAARAAR